MHARVAELVQSLGLALHPEGGHYRETYRSPIEVDPRDGRPLRRALTGIYFLLAKGDLSRWHVVPSDEIWTHLEGDPVRLWTYDPATGVVDSTLLGPLGPLAALGSHGITSHSCAPQRPVPAGTWQAAEPLGAYALGACFVGPGFDFADFRMLDDRPDALAAKAAIAAAAPDLLRFV